MWEKLLVSIGLTFTLHLCTQVGLFSLNRNIQENIPNEIWTMAQKRDR
ncbi:hypothetical protein [Rivularia sp. UHCC 0363]|nr:hypothetical protein [Rivularia sp. UHCC 0363]MEA5593884.1 hypothetical protein [Rivularia sp. UHCC 0363]